MIICAILLIGTELVRGELRDANGHWLAGKLAELGHEVRELRTIDDDMDRIVETLKELGAHHDFLFVTGGLGPTSDDLTAAAAARAQGRELALDTRSLERVRAAFQKSGVPMHPMNEKQALFPEGATVLDNDLGTAPGFACKIGRASAFFTPGVPREMQHIFEERIVPSLPKPNAPLVVERVTVFGLPESTVAGRVESVEREFPVTLGYRAGSHEIEVKVQGQATPGEPIEVVRAQAVAARNRVIELLGDAIFVEGRVALPEYFGNSFKERNISVGFAESCTGGLVSHLVTTVAGCSTCFFGSVVSYDNSVKQGVLGVPAEILQRHGAVSEECAVAMARGAVRALGVDVGISITGIAGPSGGSPEKPVGLVHFAATSGDIVLTRRHEFRGDRAQIQRRAATRALVLGLELLRELSR